MRNVFYKKIISGLAVFTLLLAARRYLPSTIRVAVSDVTNRNPSEEAKLVRYLRFTSVNISAAVPFSR